MDKQQVNASSILEIVSLRRASSRTTKNNASLLQITFDQATIGIVHFGSQGHFVSFNRKFCEMLGYTESELYKKKIWDFDYPPDRKIGIVQFKRLIAGQLTSLVIEKRYQRNDGSLLWARVTVSMVRDQVSGKAQYIVAIIEDISSGKLAEEDRDRLIELLRKTATIADRSRAQLDAVFQSINEGISVFDMKADLILFNNALATIHGYHSISEMRKHIEHFKQFYELTQPDGTPLLAKNWPVARVLRGDTFNDLELRGRRIDIDRSWYFSYSGVPVYNEVGQQILAVVITRDITERKRLEHESQESERRLKLAVAIAHLGFWEWDITTNKFYFSPQWKHQLGYDDNEFPITLGESIKRLHPDDQQRVPDIIAAYVADPTHELRLQYRLLHRDGTYRWMMANAVIHFESTTQNQKLIGTQIDVTENKLSEQRLLAAARHDPLTGLPNRELVFEYTEYQLASARRNLNRGAVLFIDLDRFKPINDLYGHEIGDHLLQSVAKRLARCVREIDLVGRLGGDEFIIVLSHMGDIHFATTVAQHVLDSLQHPFEIDTLDISISASIGISYFPQHGSDADTLINAADVAMYQSKQLGRGNYHQYSPELTQQINTRVSIDALLKRALKHQGFKLHYQPIIDMKSGHVIGVEALLRLNGDDGILLNPECFIPIAESAGLIGQLGEWVAIEACQQHDLWKKQGLPAMPIAINVSPLQFRQRGFTQQLQSIVKTSNINPEFLQIEVTESSVMENVDDAIQTLNGLRTMGMKVALDDFGTGYSSLSHLSHLPLDKLKVDQSFVKRLNQDKTSRSITGAIIALGRTLNLEVVGEGIESKDALAYLLEQGCDQAQGYFISHPLTADEFACWYREKLSPTWVG